MTSGGCKPCQNGANSILSSHSDITAAKILAGGFIVITIGFILFTACWMFYFFRRFYDAAIHSASADTAVTTSAATTTSLPVFVCSSSSREEKIECAVCLMEMKNGEKGRLLSRCGHRFHSECIDMWLHSHSTCPLCRSKVGPEFAEPPV